MVTTLPGYSVNVIRIPLSEEPMMPEISKNDLKKLIDSVKNLKSSKYTEKSWAKFEKALSSAKKELAGAGEYQDMSVPYHNLKSAKDSLVLSPASVKINVGKTLTIGQKEKVAIKATITPSKASQKVTWKSSKTSVAEIKNQKIIGKKPGKSVITAKTSNGKIAKCTVTVKKAPKKISLNAMTSTLKKGKSYRIKIKFPKNTFSYKVTYSSNHKEIASVSEKGVVTTKKKGTAVITVKTFNGKKASIKIKVK